MLNQFSLESAKHSSFSSQFCKPTYDSYSFSRIPSTIYSLLTGKKKLHALPQDTFADTEPYPIVILLLLDGFGWCFFEKYKDRFPFLQRFTKEGIASKIFSQFPSTTASHMTTIHTGLEVGLTGLYEWFYYEPKVDAMIAPLLFSYAGDHETDTLFKSGISPLKLFPKKTFYQELKKEKITSYIFQKESIAHSPYSEAMSRGARIMPYFSLEQGIEHLLEAVSSAVSPSYFFLYHPEIDAVGHRKGIHSDFFEESILRCMKLLEEKLFFSLKGMHKKIALLVTADHGMVSVSPQKTIYLNQLIPSLLASMKKNKKGYPLVPAGSCRDFFLHILPQKEEEVLSLLRTKLQGKAEVYKVQDLIDQKFFGTSSQELKQRVGNLVILPYEGESIWWYEKHRFEQHFYAAHGGLTRGEMESLFLFMDIC